MADVEHYFSSRPTSPTEETVFETELRGFKLRFKTDRGVFSKDKIDYGTRLLIDHMVIPEEGNVLDLGCGYGPIGITAAKLSPGADVYMIDPNTRATALAKENAELNGVQGVRVLTGEGFQPFPSDAWVHFHTIITNPPYRAGKRIVHDLLTESHERLVHGGELYCVGQTKQGIKSLRRFLDELFGNSREVGKKGGYRVIASEK